MIVCAYDMATKWKRKTMYLHEIHNEVIAKIQEVIKILLTHSSELQLQLQVRWISDENSTKDVENDVQLIERLGQFQEEKSTNRNQWKLGEENFFTIALFITIFDYFLFEKAVISYTMRYFLWKVYNFP